MPSGGSLLLLGEAKTYLNVRHESTQGSQLDLGQVAESKPFHVEHHNISLDDAILADHHVIEHAERLDCIGKVHLRGIRVGQTIAENFVALLCFYRHSHHMTEMNEKITLNTLLLTLIVFCYGQITRIPSHSYVML